MLNQENSDQEYANIAFNGNVKDMYKFNGLLKNCKELILDIKDDPKVLLQAKLSLSEMISYFSEIASVNSHAKGEARVIINLANQIKDEITSNIPDSEIGIKLLKQINAEINTIDEKYINPPAQENNTSKVVFNKSSQTESTGKVVLNEAAQIGNPDNNELHDFVSNIDRSLEDCSEFHEFMKINNMIKAATKLNVENISSINLRLIESAGTLLSRIDEIEGFDTSKVSLANEVRDRMKSTMESFEDNKEASNTKQEPKEASYLISAFSCLKSALAISDAGEVYANRKTGIRPFAGGAFSA